MADATIVVCAEIPDPEWQWLQRNFSGTGLTFDIVRCVPRNALERVAPFGLARIRGSFAAVRLARRKKALAIVAHTPTVAAWCALFARALGVTIPVLAHSFNFVALPPSPKRQVFAWALKSIDRFVVFSTVERALYAKTFSLPAEKFDVVLWGVRPPDIDTAEPPFVAGAYVCAIGGNARDYRTLIEAARRLPDVRFVVVARPENFSSLAVPPNVTVYANLPYQTTMNVLAHSRFMALPLASSEVPCGHVTLVAAMHLGKAMVITDSAGVRDYVHDGDNALAVAAGSADDMAAAIKRLWDDPALCASLGENGQRFASSECTEERIVEHFRGWLRDHGKPT